MKITRSNVRIAEAKVRIARRKLVEAKKELRGLNESISTSELFPSEKVERIVKKILKSYADYFDDDWDSESEILENKPEWEDVISVDRDSSDYYLTCAIADSLSKNLKNVQDFKKAFKQYDVKCNATIKGKRISESDEMWKSLISESKSLKESVNVYDFLDADSDLVHTKHINGYIHKGNTIEVPDAPTTIEIAGHTIDYDEYEGVVVFDGVVAKCDDREELMGGETSVYYADTGNGTYTILFYYQRHGLLADVAVLEPELTKEVQYNLE